MLLKQLILRCRQYWHNKSKIQFLVLLDHGSENEASPEPKDPDIQQSKGLLR